MSTELNHRAARSRSPLIDLARSLAVMTAIASIAACGRERAHSAAPTQETRTAIVATPAVRSVTGLQGPESALYDADQDVYFISNINGGLLDRDNNGSISRLQAATLSGDLKWIAGGKNGVTLDGPKGMAILGGSLYVSDVAGVRKFDRKTGAAQGLIALPGAVCINDLVSDGRSLYVSDTGIVPAAGETFSASGTDAIWRITNDQATKLASGRDLLQPNGLAVAGGKLWAVTFGGNELYEISSGKKSEVTHLPHGQLDGIAVLPDGSFAITSWQSKTIYRGNPGGPFVPLLESVLIPADLGYDGKRHLLLVPNSGANEVTMHPVR